MYCQAEAEGQEFCDVQCSHCRTYYQPLVVDNAAYDYADEPRSFTEERHKIAAAFKAGVEFALKNLLVDEPESDKIF